MSQERAKRCPHCKRRHKHHSICARGKSGSLGGESLWSHVKYQQRVLKRAKARGAHPDEIRLAEHNYRHALKMAREGGRWIHP